MGNCNQTAVSLQISGTSATTQSKLKGELTGGIPGTSWDPPALVVATFGAIPANSVQFRLIPFNSAYFWLAFEHLWEYLHRILLDGCLVRFGCPIPGIFAEGCVETRRKFPDTCLENGTRWQGPSKAQDTNTKFRWDSKPNCNRRSSCEGRPKIKQSETGRLEQSSAAQPSCGGAESLSKI